MSIEDVIALVSHLCPGTRVAHGSNDIFFLYDPDGDLPAELQSPFATIVTGDHYDDWSSLDRNGTYRLNIGVGAAMFSELFGCRPSDTGQAGDYDYDYAAVDTVMPHPVYADQHWVCIVSPSTTSLPLLHGLLDAAHSTVAERSSGQ